MTKREKSLVKTLIEVRDFLFDTRSSKYNFDSKWRQERLLEILILIDKELENG